MGDGMSVAGRLTNLRLRRTIGRVTKPARRRRIAVRQERKYKRRRRIAAVVATALALVLSAVAGVVIQRVVGWSPEAWSQHTSIQEPGVKPELAEPVGVEKASDNAQQVPAELREPAYPHPLINPPGPGASTTIKISSAGLAREYLISLPPDVVAKDDAQFAPKPLIMAFHGLSESPQSIARYSGMGQSGAIVVYPAGVNKAWSGAPYAKTAKMQDQAFTRNVIDQVASTYQVDNNRIFAAGMSNGGGFVYQLACEMPQVFAAVASVAGAYYTDTWSGCADPQNPQVFQVGPAVPFLEIHGRKDERIMYEGGQRQGTPYLAAPQAAARYAQRSGCEDAPITTAASRKVMRTQWGNCLEGNEVVHLAIEDAGHNWPGEIEKLSGTSALGGSSSDSDAITATSEIIAFFGRHGLVLDPLQSAG